MNLNDGSKREIIPRWRPFALTNRLLELGSIQRKSAHTPAESVRWRHKLAEWRRETTIAAAWSVLEAAVVENRALEAGDAAEFILSRSEFIPPGLRSLATSIAGARERLTEASKGHFILVPSEQAEDPRATIRHIRHRLYGGPRDAIAWVDLALAYCNEGQIGKAKRAMSVALGIAPKNRFILRSASRLYVHAGEHDRALSLLARTRVSQSDPWLAAAEIATAQLAGKSPSLVKRGIELIESGQFGPHDIAELTAAVGTLELRNGKFKKGKRLLYRGLAHPTDNSIAQIEWADRVHQTNLLRQSHLATPLSFEARTWSAYVREDIKASIDAATQWAEDEPFSTQPWNFLTYMYSCVTLELDVAIETARRALTINRDSDPIRNNYVLALARRGEIDKAEEILEQIRPRTEEARVTNLATRGLVAFRRGQPEIGRQLYLDAIQLANKQISLPWLSLRARLYYLYEEAWNSKSSLTEIVDAIDPLIEKYQKAVGLPVPTHIATESRLMKEGIRAIAVRADLFTDSIRKPAVEYALDVVRKLPSH